MNSIFSKNLSRSFRKLTATLALMALMLSFIPLPASAIIYQPGATLNPACVPTDASCDVDSALFSSAGLNLGTAASAPSLTANQLYNVGGTLYWGTTALAGLSAPAAITSLNGLTVPTQTFATGTSGTNFGISSSGSAHTFNIPDASATARGLVTTVAQTIAGSKTFSSAPTLPSMTAGSVLFAGTGGLVSQNNNGLFWDNTNSRLGIGTTAPNNALQVPGLVNLRRCEI